ncbi:hypothetical protein HZS61_014751 [Fusarium oxysporum f. sp. conglutinans]|uniref:Amidase domain-containing protein n=1 Tax=Fusarium oxysporum f. sp. conglutinans TaxID=100902 RepID=A0A8H6GRV0_FUSOX|nr:hypothetical protein HZS61_014751 [Fusarium oxysporum f. sp. conglutinans]
MTTLNIVEATIEDLQTALSQGTLTSVDLVALYLRRICRYDRALNSTPILNSHVFEEAAASDDYRASGKPIRKLEGIPYTVKDSFKVKGMTVACGSPAFKDLIAMDDAFTVSVIRNQGGILIGKTNMPPMACGGMQRGIYGRAESPYNSTYLAAAFASGSSNGSAVSTTASLAAFGLGEETVSSGRSPASNNGLVAYTPSRGLISIRGNWPLYPTCDVVVPHTRTMRDMLALLQVLLVQDPLTKGDFWRDQPFVELPKLSLSADKIQDIGNHTTLQGLRFAVPAMYIGGPVPQGAKPVTVNPRVVQVWEEARRQLENLGAEIVVVDDFPAVTAYENPGLSPRGTIQLPTSWHQTERGPMVAHGWDQFLRNNADPNYPSLKGVEGTNIFPMSMRTPVELEHLPTTTAIKWSQLTNYLEDTTMYQVENLKDALIALEYLRRKLLDDYLAEVDCDGFVFPAAGDVGAADADVNPSSALHAWKNGVYYSNGNGALRHLGIPTVTVPMGMVADKQMPIGLTFAGRAYDDERLLAWANAFEIKTGSRTPPPLTPPLQTDMITLRHIDSNTRISRPLIRVDKCRVYPLDNRDMSGTAQQHVPSVFSETCSVQLQSPAPNFQGHQKFEILRALFSRSTHKTRGCTYLFHEPTFKASAAEGTVSKPVLLAMLGLSARFATEPDIVARGPMYRAQATAALKEDLEHICIENIQACILVGNNFFGEGDADAESLYFGLASRMTQILKLGEINEGDDGVMREVKRRIFWTCFIIDTWASGGSNLSPQFRWRTKQPRGPLDEYMFYNMRSGDDDVADSDWKPGLWAHMVRLVGLYAQIQNLQQELANGVEWNESFIDESVQRLEAELSAFEEGLGPELMFSRENLASFVERGLGRVFIAFHLGYHHYYTLLFYQYLDHRRPPTRNGRKYASSCKAHAAIVCDVLKASREVPGAEALYNIVGHVTIVSSSVLLHTYLFGESHELEESRDRLSSNLESLVQLRNYWPSVEMMVSPCPSTPRWFLISIQIKRLVVFQKNCIQSMNAESYRFDRWMVKFLIAHALALEDKVDDSWSAASVDAANGDAHLERGRITQAMIMDIQNYDTET